MGGNVHSHLPRRTPTHPPIAPPYPMKLDDYTRDVVESNEMERSAPLRVKIKPTVRQGRGLRFLHRALPTRPSTEPNRTGQDRTGGPSSPCWKQMGFSYQSPEILSWPVKFWHINPLVKSFNGYLKRRDETPTARQIKFRDQNVRRAWTVEEAAAELNCPKARL